MKSTKKRWTVLAVSTISLLFLGLIYAWSIFKAPLSELYPAWTESQLSLTFTISISMFCIGGFIGGITGKIFKVRTKFLITAVMLFAAFFAVSLMNTANPGTSLVMLYVFYAFLGGGGVGFAYNAIIGQATKWFPDIVGIASGIMLMGFGLGALVLGGIASSMMASIGVPATFKIIAVAIAVVMVLAAIFIKAPTEKELAAFKPAVKASDIKDIDNGVVNYTPGEMVKSSMFWLFLLWVIAISAAGLLVINNAANISVAYGGTAILGMIVSLANGFGRIINGSIFDKIGNIISLLCCTLFMLIAGVLLSLGDAAGTYILILAGLVFVGIAFGGCPALTSAYFNKIFGPKHFPTNFSLGNSNLLVASAVGPMLSSKLLVAANGSYVTNFYAVVAMAAVGFVVWIVLARVLKKNA